MKLYKYLAAALLVALAALPLFARAQPAPAAQIRALALQASLSPQPPGGPCDERAWLERFYAPRAYAPAWSAALAEQALALLQQAAADGLDPAHFGIDALRGPQPDPGAFDAALTAAMLHYLADLRLGRVPSDYHTRPPDPRLAVFDPVELLRAALGADGVGSAVRAARPASPLYAQAQAALAHYRELATLPYSPLPLPDANLAPGDRYEGARALHERLVLLGDLEPGAAPPPSAVYTAELAQGVSHFQSRHGLDEDGVLGAATVAALNQPPEQRVRQLELTLERLRWLPDFPPGPLVVVDLPAFRLWALRPGAPDPLLEMKVVVGDASKTPTPLFVGRMRYLEFHPYWNVPRSILLKEILPRMARNPGYLGRNDMEIVPAGAGVGDLAAGRARVRQRPGSRNSLGAVKFAMPNPDDIYLHATPERELFRRSRRDLSHGCIRVERPAELALFVLGDQPQWTAERIAHALEPGPTHRAELSGPIPVVIFYATAVVSHDGTARFSPDIYGRDPLLEQALAAHASQIVPAPPPPTE